MKEDPGGVLLMRTWQDAEAEIVRGLLAADGIPCQVVSDIPHSVTPLTVDGLGEIRIFVPPSARERAEAILAERREEGLLGDPGADENAPRGESSTRPTE